MSENLPGPVAPKLSTNQQLKPHGAALVRALNLPSHIALNVVRAMDARLAAERLDQEALAVVDAVLLQLRRFRPVVRLNLMKVINGELTEDALGVHRAQVLRRFKTLLDEYGAGATRVILSAAERAAKIEEKKQRLRLQDAKNPGADG